MSELVAQFLFEIRRRDQQFNAGAGVNDRGEIVILLPEAMPLTMHEATELQKKIREAVVDASLRKF